MYFLPSPLSLPPPSSPLAPIGPAYLFPILTLVCADEVIFMPWRLFISPQMARAWICFRYPLLPSLSPRCSTPKTHLEALGVLVAFS